MANRTERKLQLTLKTKLLLGVAAAVVLVVAVLLIQYRGYRQAEEKYREQVEALQGELDDQFAVYKRVAPEVDLSMVDLQVKGIGELSTRSYHYANAGKFEDSAQFLGLTLPGMTKSFVAKWEGTIKAGIDVTKVRTEYNETTRTFTVYLPEATILSHEIHSDTIETLDERSGLFNPLKVDDVRNFDATSKAEMEKQARQNGLIREATADAKTVLAGLIYKLPGFVANDYKLEFIIE